ncbi:MAG TPA: hypothetical protein VHN99_00240 [Deinococcales bacterium]|nr:hypothetical protein [Deinococcales bacterium]
MPEFSVRVAEPSDARALSGVLAALLGRPTLAAGIVEALNTNLLRLLSTPGSTLLVAEAPDGTLLGFASVWTRWGLLDQNPSGLVDQVVTFPALRESTVPAALLEQAVGACQAMGCGSVDLVLSPESFVPPQALGGMGFEPLGSRLRLEIL